MSNSCGVELADNEFSEEMGPYFNGNVKEGPGFQK
jgi:hypothetical protein